MPLLELLLTALDTLRANKVRAVLPTLGAGGVMVFPGGAITENTVLVHAGAKQSQPVRLVAQVASAGLGQPGTSGAMRVLAPALEKVETHAFPLPWSGPTVEWGGALGLTAQTVSQRARTEPALAALLATTCSRTRPATPDCVSMGASHHACAG